MRLPGKPGASCGVWRARQTLIPSDSGTILNDVLRVLTAAAKTDRLKQAKAEAEKEIQTYKSDRENAYQQKMSAVSRGAAPVPQLHLSLCARSCGAAIHMHCCSQTR